MNNLRHNPIEETEMPLYGGIDLHANNSVVVLLNDQDQVIYQKRLPNHLPTILEPLNGCVPPFTHGVFYRVVRLTTPTVRGAP